MHGGGSIAYLPITHINYLDAIRFVNWLHNGQGDGDTEIGAHTIRADGQVTRSPNARYWIPTENEWSKAAYYDPGPEGPADDYWTNPWRNAGLDSRPANYYGFSSALSTYTYAVTGRPRLDADGLELSQDPLSSCRARTAMMPIDHSLEVPRSSRRSHCGSCSQRREDVLTG